MSKTQILFELIMYVNTKRIFTAQDVANEFNISIRTAHRYLMELSEMGVPLYTEPGRNGGYRVLNNKILPPIIFNEEEAFSIFFAFQSLKYYEPIPFDINIDSVSRKLYVNLPNDTKRKVDQLHSILLYWNNKRTSHSPFLKEIIEASLSNHILNIEYITKSKNTNKKVAPIGMYAYDGFWYMPAYDFTHKEIRLYRTDRITSLENTKKYHEPQVNLPQWLSGQSTKTAKNPIRLYVELTREGIRQCRSETWLEPSIIITDEHNGYIDMIIDNSELEFVSKYFFHLGTLAKVIEPSTMVDYIRKKAQALILHYSSHCSEVK